MRLLGSEFCNSLPPVTSTILFLRDGTPHPEGLFSYEIFGTTIQERTTRFGSIFLNRLLLHPHIWMLVRRKIKAVKAILGMKPYTIQNGEIIIFDSKEEVKDKEVYYGLPYFIDNFLEIIQSDKYKDKDFAIISEKYRNDIHISCIPVMPPAYREIVSEHNLDPINSAYLKLLKYSKLITSVENNPKNETYGKIVNLMQITLQELYLAIEMKLAKKQGAIRGSLLGKRLDFSGRAVITVDPKIPVDSIGLPIRMAVKLFEPWLLRKLTLQYKFKVDEALDYLSKIALGYIDKSDENYNIIVEALEEIIKDRVVIVKRDPALHRLSLQAFKPVLVDDNTIHVSPFVTVPFNADFDGDQMAVFVPMTKEAIIEAKKLTNPYHPAYPLRLKYELNKDYKYAFCVLTKNDIDPKLVDTKTYWWWQEVSYKFNNQQYYITKGRKALIDILPQKVLLDSDLEQIINYIIETPKLDNDEIVRMLIHYINDPKYAIDYLNKLKDILSEVMTIFSNSISIADLQIADKVKHLVDKLDEKKPLEENQKIINEISKIIKEEILKNDTGLKYLLQCGVVKFNQTVQLLGTKGLVLSPDGNVKLIKSNFANGLKPTEYFEAGHGARLGIVSRAQKTAITGYLQRQMIYAAASVELDPNIDDCGTGKTIKLYVEDEDLAKRLIDRYIVVNNNITKITDYKDIIGKEIELRSPIYCISKKICRTCYGDSYKYINSTKIGFVAAEAIGERFSQEMMKAFHVGGVVKFEFPNPIEESSKILLVDKSLYEKVFEYDETNKVLKAKTDLNLVLDREFYNLNPLITQEVQELRLEQLICDIESNGQTIPFSYSEPVILYSPDEIKKYSDVYVASYKPGSILKVIPVSPDDIESRAKKLFALLNGKFQVKSPEQLLNTMYSLTKSFGMFILVHLEVLLSQIMRCASNPKLPYRLCPGNELKLVGIKNIARLESWKRGLEFERFKDSINEGLISDEIDQTESLLDELL